MPDQDPKKSSSLSDQLSDLQFGPAWARAKETKKDYSSHQGESRGKDRKGKREGGGGRDRRPPQRNDRRDSRGGGSGGSSDRGGGRDRRGPQRPQVEPTAKVSCKLLPCKKAVEAIGQQITKTGHTYPLYTLAKFVLGDRARYIFVFEAEADGPELIRGKIHPALVLSRSEAVSQLWQNELFSEFYEAEQVETEPPSGNFPSIAKCGFSGTLLGPPNYHGYQAAIAKLHREKFANMSLDRYKSRIETLNDEESIEQWRAQMSQKTIYATKPAEGQEVVKFDDQAAVEQHFVEHHFDAAFEVGKRFIIPGNIATSAISPGLLEWIKRHSSDARKKPAALIPTLCNVLTGQHIAVFKWQDKLHSGPSRPHALPLDSKIADGPTALLDLIGENQGIELPQIVEKITGQASDAPETAEQRKRLLSDLHWLLKEGYALLLEGGQLHVPKKPIKDRPKQEQEAMIKSQEAQQEIQQEPKKDTTKPSSPEPEATPEKATDAPSEPTPSSEDTKDKPE